MDDPLGNWGTPQHSDYWPLRSLLLCLLPSVQKYNYTDNDH